MSGGWLIQRPQRGKDGRRFPQAVPGFWGSRQGQPVETPDTLQTRPPSRSVLRRHAHRVKRDLVSLQNR
jgi:hypothetical protein